MSERQPVRIITKGDGIRKPEDVKVMLGDVEIPHVCKVEFGRDGGGLDPCDLTVIARITLAVSLGD